MRIDLSNKSPEAWGQSVVLDKNGAVALFEELHLEGPLNGEFQIFPQGGESFLVRGSVSGVQVLTCVRTLEPFSRPFQVEVLVEVRKSVAGGTQELDDEDDTFVVNLPSGHDEVDLSECVRQLVILQEPMNPVKEPAGDFVWKDAEQSAEPETDPRWEKLKALKAKLGNPNG